MAFTHIGSDATPSSPTAAAANNALLSSSFVSMPGSQGELGPSKKQAPKHRGFSQRARDIVVDVDGSAPAEDEFDEREFSEEDLDKSTMLLSPNRKVRRSSKKTRSSGGSQSQRSSKSRDFGDGLDENDLSGAEEEEEEEEQDDADAARGAHEGGAVRARSSRSKQPAQATAASQIASQSHSSVPRTRRKTQPPPASDPRADADAAANDDDGAEEDDEEEHRAAAAAADDEDDDDDIANELLRNGRLTPVLPGQLPRVVDRHHHSVSVSSSSISRETSVLGRSQRAMSQDSIAPGASPEEILRQRKRRLRKLLPDPPCLSSISHQIKLISSQAVAFFAKSGSLSVLNKCAWLHIIHIYQHESSIPPKLSRNVAILDEAYPKIKIDLLLVKGDFSPTTINYLSYRLSIPKNLMFLTCPKKGFAHKLDALGGVRLITH